MEVTPRSGAGHRVVSASKMRGQGMVRKARSGADGTPAGAGGGRGAAGMRRVIRMVAVTHTLVVRHCVLDESDGITDTLSNHGS